MIIVLGSVVRRVFAFLLEIDLDCCLHTEICWNGENMVQGFIFDAASHVLQEIAGFCSRSLIPFNYI